jgi:DNA-binding transcriptional LysR family regulator
MVFVPPLTSDSTAPAIGCPRPPATGSISCAYSASVELRRWTYFAVLAEEMNFTRAAERLLIAQSALSQQIRVFERELATPLLRRSGPRFELTHAGEIAAQEARKLLASAEQARQRVEAAARGEAGVLHVAYTRSAPGPPASEIIQEYRRQHPGVDIRLETGWTTRNVERLLAGHIDVGFVRPPVDEPELTVHTVGTEELLLAVPADHPLASRDTISRKELRHEPVISWPRSNGPGQHDAIRQQLWPDAVPQVVREEPDDEQLLLSVASGTGIAALPKGRARSLHIPGIALKRLATPTPRITLGLAHRANDPAPTVRAIARLAAPDSRLSRTDL